MQCSQSMYVDENDENYNHYPKIITRKIFIGKLCKIGRNESTRFYLRGGKVKFNSQIDGLFFMAEVGPGTTTDVGTDKRLTAARR